MKKLVVLVGLFWFGLPVSWAEDRPTADSLIQKLEAHQNPPSLAIEGEMSLKDRFGTRQISFRSWSRGADKMLLEFTSDAEFGQKILRLGKDLYLYFPDAEKTVTLRGSALGDSVLGSDMSYEDLTGNKSLLDSYTAQVTGDEVIQNRPCWIVALKAKVKDVAYDAETLWIDKADFVTRQAHQFARSGRLLRTLVVLEIRQDGGYFFPARMILQDQLKKTSSTEFRLTKVDLTTAVPDSRFNLKELGK